MFINNNNNNIYLNIYLQSADKYVLYNFKIKIENILNKNKYKYLINYLPKKNHHYNILRSPHIYKKSSEAYKEQIYSLNIIIQTHNYKNLIFFIKFFKNNIPLAINIKFKLKNNVKTNIL